VDSRRDLVMREEGREREKREDFVRTENEDNSAIV